MQSLNLNTIINIEKIQYIQDNLAIAMDIAIILVDYKGNPITRHSNCSQFCYGVRKDSKLNRLCEKCDSRGGLEAARSQKAFMYQCHVGLVDIAIPIIIEDQYLGALMAGQVRVIEEENSENLERIVSNTYQINLEQYPELKELFKSIPILSKKKIEAIAQTMQHMISYFIDEAVFKSAIYDEVHDVQLYYTTESKSQNNLLLPALDYIKSNYQKKIMMDDMAKRCNISTSYFSKLFKRQIGINFSAYVNQIKLEKAKELLENTTLPIINISLDLGYDDCGYFIKIFKKCYKVTPAKYRKTLRSN
ncbi:PocR ligand-binding domain-containing protein [Vallitalea okinawensis]|uniref:PocR ligand-binding domain-containing protein n=1 Tax=Vallitalea okinawensis TaxID=2078660 RepID=UPI000CFD2A18|nr:PocR ligand-binding domain-containing protein [Vallitalea okinawensis]